MVIPPVESDRSVLPGRPLRRLTFELFGVIAIKIALGNSLSALWILIANAGMHASGRFGIQLDDDGLLTKRAQRAASNASISSASFGIAAVSTS